MNQCEWHCIAWLCWCVIKNLLTHSLTHSLTLNLTEDTGELSLPGPEINHTTHSLQILMQIIKRRTVLSTAGDWCIHHQDTNNDNNSNGQCCMQSARKQRNVPCTLVSHTEFQPWHQTPGTVQSQSRLNTQSTKQTWTTLRQEAT